MKSIHSTWAAVLGAFALPLFTCALPGATVQGRLVDISQQALDTRIIFAPVEDVLISPSGLSAGPPRIIASSNGLFNLLLEAGDYQVTLPLIPARKPFMIAVPQTTATLNITNLMNPPRTYFHTNAPFPGETNIAYLAGDLAPSGGNVRSTAGDEAPLYFPDTIAVFKTGAGGRTTAVVPCWVTQAVSVLTVQWSASQPLRWTNRCQTHSHPDAGARVLEEEFDLPVWYANHLNSVLFTSRWPTNNQLKSASILQPFAQTNTERSVQILKWRMQWSGTPVVENR